MDADDFTAMIEETNVESRIVEYYANRNGNLELISFSLVDILDDGISMVYSVFDPDMKERSLGTYMIMDHNDLALEMKLKFVYLGYWVKGSSKMDYKKDLALFKYSRTINGFVLQSSSQKLLY